MAPLVLVPPILTALGEAAAAALPWILGTTVVVGTGAVVVNEMSKAEEEAKARERTGTTTQVCSTCEPPRCKELNDEIEKFRDELTKRYDEFRVDKESLFANHYYKWQAKPGIGSWEGHLEQYKGKQEGLRNRLNESAKLGCKQNVDDAWRAATRPAPTQPAPKP